MHYYFTYKGRKHHRPRWIDSSNYPFETIEAAVDWADEVSCADDECKIRIKDEAGRVVAVRVWSLNGNLSEGRTEILPQKPQD